MMETMPSEPTPISLICLKVSLAYMDTFSGHGKNASQHDQVAAKMEEEGGHNYRDVPKLNQL